MQAGDFDEIFVCSCCQFWSPSPTFVFVLSRFLFLKNVVLENLLFVLKMKNDFRLMLQRISGYTKAKVTGEDLYLV